MLGEMVVELLDGLTRKLIAGDHIADINRPVAVTTVTSESFVLHNSTSPAQIVQHESDRAGGMDSASRWLVFIFFTPGDRCRPFSLTSTSYLNLKPQGDSAV